MSATRVDPAAARRDMVERQLRLRGIVDPSVLRAMETVPREAFLPERLGEFAYEDAPLPIGEEQTISQPYIVARMLQELGAGRGDRVLEVGAGSGYAAAVLAEIAGEVYAVERHASLAMAAAKRLAELGYTNVNVRHGDGTRGWPEVAPFQGILVSAGGETIPEPLLEQLDVGGRLVIPVGPHPGLQVLLRVTRTAERTWDREELAPVSFVPLVAGAAGEGTTATTVAAADAVGLVGREAEAFADLEHADLQPLLERIGDARVVLIGEASHGTSEFYRLRARITRALVERGGFPIVAAEADWPDASRVDRYVRHREAPLSSEPAFRRFPVWMWRNREVLDFVGWLRDHNEGLEPGARTGFYGLDLYSLRASIAAVLEYLDDVDPEAARTARERYGCLTPWQRDPTAYGAAMLTARFESCEQEVVRALQDLLARRLEYAERADGERFFDAAQNARLVREAETYYRTVYYGGAASWNLRDEHMFDTLLRLLEFRGPDARAVVWAHNSHLGDASATDMATRGQLNVGQLAREHFREQVYGIGFGTDHGHVAAARDWDGPMEVRTVRPAHPDSYEHLCHETGRGAFLLPLRRPSHEGVRTVLLATRLERAIGVIYRPETELASHYFEASLPKQFDEYAFFDETTAVEPLGDEPPEGVPETWPFGV